MKIARDYHGELNWRENNEGKPAEEGEVTTTESEKLNETAPESEIEDLPEETKEAILGGLTEEEKAKYENGEGLYLYLQVEDVSHKVPEKDKEKIDSVKGDRTVGMYVDLTLFLKIGNMLGRPLPKPGGNVEVSMDLPPSLRNFNSAMNRVFAIIHIHDGEQEVISAQYDAKTNKLTFKTSGFSTFAIAYMDVPVSAAETENTTGNRMENTTENTVGTAGNQANAAETAKSTESVAADVPNTGDETNVLLYVLFALAGGVGAVCAAQGMRNRKCRKGNG